MLFVGRMGWRRGGRWSVNEGEGMVGFAILLSGGYDLWGMTVLFFGEGRGRKRRGYALDD